MWVGEQAIAALPSHQLAAGGVIASLQPSENYILGSERDAIKAYRPLFVKGKILNYDFFSNNIVTTNLETANGFRGMLIDLA